MAIFLFAGLVFLVFALLFWFAPDVIIKLSEIGNKMIFTDHRSFAHRRLSGIVLLIMSIIMFYMSLRF